MAKKEKKNDLFYTEETYIGIDGELGVDTEEQKLKRAYQILDYTRGARKGKDSMITAFVDGVQEKPFLAAICYYEGFKIIIPAEEFMDFPVYDPKKHPYEGGENHMRLTLMKNSIGSEIDFCVMPKKSVGKDKIDTINIQDGFAICSRKHAMNKRYREMWMKQSDGSRRIREGVGLAARCVRVSNTVAWFESNGVEFSIPNKELSWNQLNNVSEVINPGQRVIVRINSIKYAEDEEHERPVVTASLKQMQKNPGLVFCDNMRVEDIYAGRITSAFVNKNTGKTSFFVHCTNGADVMCTITNTLTRYPYVNDKVTIRITEIKPEDAHIYGVIFGITSKESDW